MRTKIQAVVVLAAALAVLSSAQRLPIDAPKDGLPMCIPSYPCVNQLPNDAPKNGPGPMCFPGFPCVKHLPINAPKDGLPMCIPSMPCANR